MNGKIVLDIRENQKRKNGFPVICQLSNKGKRIVVNLKLCFEINDWNFDLQEPKKDKRAILYIRKKKSVLNELLFAAIDRAEIDLQYVKNALLNLDEFDAEKNNSFFDFTNVLIKEKIKKTDSKGFPKIGTANVYYAAMMQLKKYRNEVYFSDFNYNFLLNFIQYKAENGIKKNTIHMYLRTYKAIYNEAVRRGITPDAKPFVGVLTKVAVPKNRTKKRNIEKQSIKLLEKLHSLPKMQQFAVDMWLLLFYFGGQDFKDVYYLENSQINNGRVYFVRGKIAETGYQFDLKIFEKAQKIIDKYNTKTRFVFPGRKDFQGYKNLAKRMLVNLHIVQQKNNINVLPLGGKLTTKVARHTFATIGKQLFIETDLLRELMGHERNEIDTIYKDKYPEAVRDDAHQKIIL